MGSKAGSEAREREGRFKDEANGAQRHHTMKAAERQLRIRQMFETRDFVDLETLCRDFDTSESSVRRDLDLLGRKARCAAFTVAGK